jgi:exonuclease SbcD
MLGDQVHILGEVLKVVEAERPDAVLIAGDVYDKPVPGADAVNVLDDFLVKLSATGTKVFVASGNHDSAERIAFGARLMEKSGVHVSPVYSGAFAPVTLRDSDGEVDVWMLPFVRPVNIRSCLKSDEERDAVKDYTSAVKAALAQMHFTPGRRNVLLAHQFVTGAERSESEENVGGLDNVDATVFEKFDYVALGHIHIPCEQVHDGIMFAQPGSLEMKSLDEPKSKFVEIVDMDENGFVHEQAPRSQKVAERIGCLAALVGIFARRPGVTGSGMIAASRTSMSSHFSNVKKVKALRRMNTIMVNEPFGKNRVYVNDEDFDFVYDFIIKRCPKAGKKQ